MVQMLQMKLMRNLQCYLLNRENERNDRGNVWNDRGNERNDRGNVRNDRGNERNDRGNVRNDREKYLHYVFYFL